MLQFLLLLLSCSVAVSNGLQSRPFVPYRTFPHDQKVHHQLTFSSAQPKSKLRLYNQKTASDNTQCPLQFTLGLSRRSHTAHSQKSLSITQPPVIYPIHPSRGPGRQVLHTTLYEHVDLLTPSFKEGLVQEPDFPLLFESSSFGFTYPILHDTNGDGVMDAIVADYDGGIYFFSISSASNYFHRTQVPRLFIRRDWMIHRLNETRANFTAPENTNADPYEPYHAHFEYLYDHDRGVLQGVTANILKQEHKDAQSLSERRTRRDPVKEALARGEGHHRDGDEPEEHNVIANEEKKEEEQENHEQEAVHRQETEEEQEKQNEEQVHRRLQEVVPDEEKNEERQQDEKRQEQNLHEEKPNEHYAQDEKPKEENAQDTVNKVEENAIGNQEDRKAETSVQQNVLEPNATEKNVEHQEKAQADTQSEESGVNTKGGEDFPDQVLSNLDRFDANEMKHEADKVRKFDQDTDRRREFDDDFPSESVEDENSKDMDEVEVKDDDRPQERYDDDYRRHADDAYNRYDDYYAGRHHNEAYDEYYDNKHYVRVPPHILCNPVLAEMKKLYGDQHEMEDMLFVAVSYYLDEDEYEGFLSYKRFDNVDRGDETEAQRGMYVASAIMVYTIADYMRWGRQEQLDLSGDATAPQNATLVGEYPIVSHDTKFGAFALSSPTVVDLDGDGDFEVLMGTSMGLVYGFDARNLFGKEGWPVQMKHPVESRILVEDVMGDTDLEIFVADIGGNIVCLDKQGTVLWHRDLVKIIDETAELLGSSPMSLGDVDGDGLLDLVLVLKFASENQPERSFIVAISAVDGKDLPNFPISVESKTATDDAEKELHQKLPQPLLVDLHADQNHWKTLFNRSATSVDPVKVLPKPPHGGSAKGLHVVQPISSDLFIIEAGSGCIQTIAIGDEVAAMVQADDVHGTDRIDLVISTASGSIVTLESPAVPYHPLNVWNNGEVRGRRNSFAQGYGASQGIFVHKVSRRYRDVFGVYVPVTFEIFDKRPSIDKEPAKRVYKVQIRDGTSSKRVVMLKEYNSTGVFTERIYISFGPGYYSLSAMLTTTHGLIYEDTFHLGYNVHFMDGFGLLLWLPLVLAAIPIIFCGRNKLNWDEEDYDDGAREERGLGILGRALPLTNAA